MKQPMVKSSLAVGAGGGLLLVWGWNSWLVPGLWPETIIPSITPEVAAVLAGLMGGLLGPVYRGIAARLERWSKDA